jgi:hypothetical protein
MAGGIAALEDTDFTNKVLKNNQLAKEFTVAELKKME